MLDFVKVLLTAPVTLPWEWICAACGILLVLCFLIAWPVAFIHAHAGNSWRELLVTTTRIRVSWIWGWAMACFVLLAYVSTLAYLERMASWIAALPYLITAVLVLAIAAGMRRSLRRKVVDMQKLVQGGQR